MAAKDSAALTRLGLILGCAGPLLAVGLVLASAAMYPGGSELQADDPNGFRWGTNYLSDLGRGMSFNNQSNGTGSLLFAGALLLLAGSALPLFVSFLQEAAPSEEEEEDAGNAAGMRMLAGVLGCVGCLALAALALFPVEGLDNHVMILYACVLLFLLAAGAHTLTLFQAETLVWAIPGAAFAAALLLYLFTGVSPTFFQSDTGPPIASSAAWTQIVVGLAGIAWVVLNSARLLLFGTSANVSESATPGRPTGKQEDRETEGYLNRLSRADPTAAPASKKRRQR